MVNPQSVPTKWRALVIPRHAGAAIRGKIVDPSGRVANSNAQADLGQTSGRLECLCGCGQAAKIILGAPGAPRQARAPIPNSSGTRNKSGQTQTCKSDPVARPRGSTWATILHVTRQSSRRLRASDLGCARQMPHVNQKCAIKFPAGSTPVRNEMSQLWFACGILLAPLNIAKSTGMRCAP